MSNKFFDVPPNLDNLPKQEKEYELVFDTKKPPEVLTVQLDQDEIDVIIKIRLWKANDDINQIKILRDTFAMLVDLHEARIAGKTTIE